MLPIRSGPRSSLYLTSGQGFLAANELDQVVPAHARYPPRRALAAFPQPRALGPPGGKPGLGRKSATDDALDLRYRQESARLVPRSVGEVFAELAPFVCREAVGCTPGGGLRWFGRLLRYCKTAVSVQLFLPTPLLRVLWIFAEACATSVDSVYPKLFGRITTKVESTTPRGCSRLGKLTTRSGVPRSSRFDTRPLPL